MTPTATDIRNLAMPFPVVDIEWRLQKAGATNGRVWAQCLAYITNRAIMERLDEVVGPENWRNELTAGPCGGVMCGISIRVGDEWITKYDVAENTDVEAVKGGASGAMKRAAVQWGIGRYLYRLDTGWARVHDGGRFHGRTKDGTAFRWEPPELPAWARPESRPEGHHVPDAAAATAPPAEAALPAQPATLRRLRIELRRLQQQDAALGEHTRRWLARRGGALTETNALEVIGRMRDGTAAAKHAEGHTADPRQTESQRATDSPAAAA